MTNHVKNYLKHFDIGMEDTWQCEVCGKQDHIVNLEIHHIIFRSHCGGDEVTNLICLCKNCHRKAHSSVNKAVYQAAHEIFLENH